MEGTGMSVDQDPMSSGPVFYTDDRGSNSSAKNEKINVVPVDAGNTATSPSAYTDEQYLSLPRSVDQTDASQLVRNRDGHVRRVMRSREKEYTQLSKSRIFCGTWNVNGKGATEDILPWLKHAKTHPPIIIALGFQELDLSKEVYLFSSPREEEWRKVAESAVSRIDSSTSYLIVKVVRMVGVMLIVFASDKIAPHISKVAASSVPTGIMGFLGNKGGVAVRLQVHSTSICFVSTHLAAHMDQYERRNQDFRDINSRMTFAIDGIESAGSIQNHDMVFWLGDLNYRVSGIDLLVVRKCIEEKNLSRLLANDQLKILRDANQVFQKYKEAEITFNPTYKYDVGTDDFDSSEKARCPAWTDRILSCGKSIKPIEYDSHMELRLSDHKPVSCTFDVGVKIVDPVKYRVVYEDVMKMLDKLENEYLPQVKLDTLELDFGPVEFMEPVVKIVKLTNTGQVPADYSFIPKLNEESFCKDWLTTKPCEDCVLPGDVVEIEFTLYVDKKTAAGFNSGVDSLEDILVFHLDGGKDFFITVSGSYSPSCFGASLGALIQLVTPMSQTPREDILKLEATAMLRESQNAPLFPVPKELWWLCEHINSNGKREEDLFQQRGLHQEIVEIRRVLDSSRDITNSLPGTAYSVAEALLIFLDSLREPVIPFSYYDEALTAANSREDSINVISTLLPIHKKVFEYLVEFMLELLKYSTQNNLDVDILVNVFSPVLIRTDSHVKPTKAEQQILELRKAKFLKHFLCYGTGL